MQIYKTIQVHGLTNLKMTAVVFTRNCIFNFYYLFPTCECLLSCIYFLLAKVCQKISGFPSIILIMEDC